MASVMAATEIPVDAGGAFRVKALRALGNLPPFSPILNRLMATLAGENVSFSKLGDLIEKDTVVAGNLLHLVNSALYARRGTINSVRHALSLLGIDKVRNAVLGMSLTRMWSKIEVPRCWSMAGFDMHSAAVAILSDLLAQRLPVEYPEGAFAAGLLHDLGHLLIATSLPAQYEAISCQCAASQNPLDREREVLGFTHAQLSAEALAAWNLPAPIQVAALNHHDPEPERSGQLPLSLVLAAANNFVNALRVTVAPSGDSGASDASFIERLGLDPERMEETLREFKAEHETMTQFFRNR